MQQQLHHASGPSFGEGQHVAMNMQISDHADWNTWPSSHDIYLQQQLNYPITSTTIVQSMQAINPVAQQHIPVTNSVPSMNMPHGANIHTEDSDNNHTHCSCVQSLSHDAITSKRWVIKRKPLIKFAGQNPCAVIIHDQEGFPYLVTARALEQVHAPDLDRNHTKLPSDYYLYMNANGIPLYGSRPALPPVNGNEAQARFGINIFPPAFGPDREVLLTKIKSKDGKERGWQALRGVPGAPITVSSNMSGSVFAAISQFYLVDNEPVLTPRDIMDRMPPRRRGDANPSTWSRRRTNADREPTFHIVVAPSPLGSGETQII